MKIRTAFPYATVHEDVRVPLADGTRLYARVWRPLTDEPVPALLEYDPHRLTDWSAPRDRQRHPWYAGHGYASVRVDARGHGNSEGLPGDLGSGAEPSDCAEVIDWLAARPWCTGRVGMFGVGRGGTAALRTAALAPEPLRAVVAVACPDGRYEAGVPHRDGPADGNGPEPADGPDGAGGPADGPAAQDGPADGNGTPGLSAALLARSAALLALAACPPDPRYAGDAWREMWPARLEALAPPAHAWLAHPAGDDHAGTGGPGPGGGAPDPYASVRAAVLAVGGWHDPYHDTVLRLVAHLPDDLVRGVIGPWAHQYPDREQSPGPAIGFLQETLRWWDHHLKGEPTGVMSEPLLRSWIGTPSPPVPARPEPGPRPGPGPAGRWVGDGAWPSPNVTPVTYALQGPPVLVRSPQHTGLDAGRPVPSGDPAGLPPDQRAEDAHAACFDFPVPHDGAPVDVLGRPRVALTLRAEAPAGQVAVRLCDVAPDGSSTLVTRGAARLAAGPGGGPREYVFELDGTGHAFPPGHRIRLAVSSAYWPRVWPGPRAAGFTLDPAACSLRLPVRRPTTDSVAFAEPEQAEPLGVTVPAALDDPETRRPARLIVRDVAAGEWRLEDRPSQDGTHAYPDGLEITEDAVETCVITEGEPLSARARTEWRIRLHRPDIAWNVTVDARSEIVCDATHFLTTDEVICAEGPEVVFHHTWEKRIARAPG
ncbi:CocE/NonD family hydrolase [Streptomyces lavendofoliae]|uniref:Peptidase S15 n=1 Tax=Streptomyces lavendofoliae TaxID=67314 RepID=A0A918I291_9ACTN|nr:CocE/NonD family hydrolase [Streptomyces lavendofoliae]GGU60609.1 peptidase S15 [Streptomyces lavendofoliae]